MKYKKDWEEAKCKWKNYWKQENMGRPLMGIIARKPEIEIHADGKPAEGGYRDVICQGKYYQIPSELMWRDMEDKYQNPERMVARYVYFCETHEFMGESFPNLNIDFGPGSLAAYLGSDIEFQEDTVWFHPCLKELNQVPEFRFNIESPWFKKHLDLAKKCRMLAGDDFYVDMPDLMENLDVLASLRGAQEMLYDFIDEPEIVKESIRRIGEVHEACFHEFYKVICDKEGGNAYTVFQIWGPGKTVKLQCDFSSMLSPGDFREFIQESLRLQASKADQVLYHLDGEDAIRHLDALMEIEEIDALQWTSGDAGPDGTWEKWDSIYDKVIASGKSLWIKVYTGGFEDWIRNADRIVKKYGSRSLYLLFPEMSYDQAQRLLEYGEKNWSNVDGIVK